MRVFAKNRVGYSAPSVVVSDKPRKSPAAPPNANLTVASNRSLDVFWTPVGHHHDGGAGITKYRVEWFRSGMLGQTEVQTVKTSGNEELSGAFTLTSHGQTTAPLPFDASPFFVEQARREESAAHHFFFTDRNATAIAIAHSFCKPWMLILLLARCLLLHF